MASGSTAIEIIVKIKNVNCKYIKYFVALFILLLETWHFIISSIMQLTPPFYNFINIYWDILF